MASILIVEDEKAIADLILIHTKMAGHEATAVYDGSAVMAQIEQSRPDLILLDVMLPGMDGFSLMRQIEPMEIPVIFLTAKNRLDDKVTGLRLGADDYIVKPFEALELTTRIESVLHRYRRNNKVFRLGSLEVRLDERVALVDGCEIELTIKEFELLQALIENRNLALSRDKLLELVWGFDYGGESRTVDVHIQRLRKKLNLENAIKTVYKLGYRLEVPR